MSKAQRGFAYMSKAKQRAIAGLGGKAAHAMGVAHRWTKEEASRYGRKGGLRKYKTGVRIISSEAG